MAGRAAVLWAAPLIRAQPTLIRTYSTSPTPSSSPKPQSEPPESEPKSHQQPPQPSPLDYFHTSYIPLLNPRFWLSLIPQSLRRSPFSAEATPKSKKKAEWNPATFFIWMAVCIGSASVNHVVERRTWMEFSRRAEVRIEELREVLRRVQRGERVGSGAGVLGAGEEEGEREWKEVLRELQSMQPAPGGSTAAAKGKDASGVKGGKGGAGDADEDKDEDIVPKVTRGEFY